MKIQKKSLLNFYSRTFYILIATLILVLSLSSIILFKETNSELVIQKRKVISELLLESIKTPIIQGSYLEAVQRLNQAKKNSQIACFVLIEPYYFNGCSNFNFSSIEKILSSVDYGNSDGHFLIKVEFYYSQEKNEMNPWYLIIFSLFLLVASSLAVFIILSSQKKKIFSDFNSLYKITGNAQQNTEQDFEFREFLEVGNQLRQLTDEKLKSAKERAVLSIATQVAHDIRSPLEVLKGLKEEIAGLPEASRKRVQLSILRIEEITFNLLKTYKHTSGVSIDAKPEELLSLITSVVTEKNIEYRNFYEVDIVGNVDSDSYGLFSKIQRSALKSIISNLINNSIEALNGNSGSIELTLLSQYNRNIIKIIDNGSGIPAAICPNIFSKGFTTKKTGNGIGLYNARKDIEAVGGTINFESLIDKGTTFTISLPKSETPPTFISSIDTYKYERIIVLDDDPAFHEVWNKRLEGLESKVEHIHSVEEMLSKYQALHPKILLLSDFELMDKNLDGIDTILKLNHAEHSVLVTARNEEQAIQDRCLKSGIKLLPKSLVNYVKVVKDLSESSKLEPASMVGDGVFRSAGEAYGIYIEGGQARSGDVVPVPEALKFGFVAGAQGREGESCSSDTQDGQIQKPYIVLIDDDKLVHLNWASHCKKNGLPFCGFKSVDEFLVQSSAIDPDSRIYIDSNLGDGIKGEIESEKIFALGFLNLYLATGYEKDSIKKPAWIKEIYSKSPKVIR